MSWGDVQLDPKREHALTDAARRFLAPSRIVGKVLLVYVAVVVPVLSFAVGWKDPPNNPEWQSGDLHAHLSFMLTGRVAWVFFPLLIVASGCLVLVLFWRRRFSKYSLIRGGVYTGVLLGLHFSFLFTVSLTEAANWWAALASYPVVAFFTLSAGVMGVAIVQSVILVIVEIHRRFDPRWVWCGVAVLLFAFLGLCAIIASPEELGALVLAPFMVVLFGSLFCGTFWYLAAFAYLSWDLAREHWEKGQFRIAQVLVVFTWLGGYLAACRAAIDKAWLEYEQLPTSPPQNCYIATAAARGHPIIVRSHVVVLCNGREMKVNRQLQTLKYGEIALQAIFPKIHRAIRVVYDLVGPIVARRMTIALLGDVAYLLLKPLEWLMLLSLKCVSSEHSQRIGQVYHQRDAD